MAATQKKNIVLRVDPSFHKKVKLYTTERDITLTDFFVELAKKEMERATEGEKIK